MELSTLISTLIAAISMAAGALVWTIRQEGRINSHDIRFIEREKYDALRSVEQDRRHEDSRQALIRIESKMDTHYKFFVERSLIARSNGGVTES